MILFSGQFIQNGTTILFDHEELENLALNSGMYFKTREQIISKEMQELADSLINMKDQAQNFPKGLSWDGKREFTVNGGAFPQYLNLAGEFILLVEMLNPGTTNAYRTERAANYVDEDKRFYTLALKERGLLPEDIHLLIELTSNEGSFFSEAVRVDEKKKAALQTFLERDKEQITDTELSRLLDSMDHEMNVIESNWTDKIFSALSLRVSKILVSYLNEKDYSGYNRYFHFGPRTREEIQSLKSWLDSARNTEINKKELK